MANILLVEDYRELREELTIVFEDENYVVYPEETITQAYLTFQKEQIDLCILDVGLPDGSGFDLCEKIRAHSNVPIIFLTASADEENIINGLRLGGDDYISKPFRLGELLARMQVQLKRNTSDCETLVLKSGALQFDTAHHRILHEGEELSVTPLEFMLCMKVLQSKGKTVSRKMLRNLISQQTNSYIEDNTLTVYLSRLKKKLGKYMEVEYIETVRGFGYCWGVAVHER